ncbi:MAG: amidase [Alphaproteobacteria bacterium]|nr:amidase [Alphaproteobacteria bacterium]MDE2337539.1 amidase [Alphaproteobacteria bacterium]
MQLSVREILALYQRRELSPVEMMEVCLKQILKYNPMLNAFAFLDEKHALHQAKGAERRWKRDAPAGLLDGIPVTIKDWFHHKGWPTRYGSLASSQIAQNEDSPPVARLREQGAIFLGKTTLPEYGHKGVTHSPLTGITRNPWNRERTSGGSSGGAAVAAVTGMGLLHLGSDAGGSIRIPASFSGAFGFKPSPGLVPNWPPSLFSTLSSTGPLARCVDDAALMLDVVTQPDARDWFALPFPSPNFSAALKKPLPKLRIAYATSINGITPTPEVTDVLKKVRPLLDALGKVEEITLTVPHLVDVFNKHWSAVASWSAAQFGAREKKKLDPRFLHWAAQGDALPLHDYLQAERDRMTIGEYFKSLLDTHDILVTPTTAMTAFEAGADMPVLANGRKWDDWTPFTYPANLARLPAASLPAGLDKNGLPVGLQVMGGYLKDALVLQACKKLEETLAFTPWTLSASPDTPPGRA